MKKDKKHKKKTTTVPITLPSSLEGGCVHIDLTVSDEDNEITIKPNKNYTTVVTIEVKDGK